MRRVMVDWLRQTRSVWLVLLVIFTVAWLVALRETGSTGTRMLLNFCALAANVMGVLSAMGSTDARAVFREVYALPVTRRDFGRGLWLAAVFFPVLLTSVARLMAVIIAPAILSDSPVRLSWAVSAAAFDIAYVGSLVWLLMQDIGRPQTVGWRRPLISVLRAAGTVVMLASTLALAWYMPTTASEWHWPIVAALAGMLGLTTAGFIQSDRLVVYGGLLESNFGAHRRTRVARGKPTRPAAFSSRVSFLWRTVWEQFRNAAFSAAIFMAVFLVMGSMPWSGTQGRLEQIREALPEMHAELGAQVWVFGWMLYFLVGKKRWQPARILLLRTLPVSSRELNLLLLARPVVSWFAYWLALLPTFLLSPASGHPWMGLGSVIGWVGVSSLSSTAMLRWHQRPLVHMAPIATFYIFLFGRKWVTLPSFPSSDLTQMVSLALGLSCLIASAVWNRRLLTQAHLLFRT